MKLLKLDLEKEAPRPARLGFWGFVDLCAIALFFILFGSKFIVAPGVSIELPQLTKTQNAMANEYDVLTVSEIDGEEMVIYRGMVLNLVTFRKQLALREERPEGYTLLVRSDANVSIQTFVSLSEIAIEGGYEKVQLATEREQGREDVLDQFIESE